MATPAHGCSLLASPTAEDLQHRSLVKYAFAHIKAITDCGAVIGCANINFGDAPLVAEALQIPTWGYHVPKVLAERLAQTVAWLDS